jgi:uncharacterized membrane protein YdbT with pleckstrin-like domain
MNQLPDKKNDPLKKLISKNMLEQPSDQFTASVMGKLGIAPAPAGIRYEPVISAKGWIFIALVTGLLIYLALSGSATESFSSKTIMVQSVMQQGTSFFEQLFSGSVMALIAIATLAIFLLSGAESMYRRSQMRPA